MENFKDKKNYLICDKNIYLNEYNYNYKLLTWKDVKSLLSGSESAFLPLSGGKLTGNLSIDNRSDTTAIDSKLYVYGRVNENTVNSNVLFDINTLSLGSTNDFTGFSASILTSNCITDLNSTADTNTISFKNNTSIYRKWEFATNTIKLYCPITEKTTPLLYNILQNNLLYTEINGGLILNSTATAIGFNNNIPLYIKDESTSKSAVIFDVNYPITIGSNNTSYISGFRNIRKISDTNIRTANFNINDNGSINISNEASGIYAALTLDENTFDFINGNSTLKRWSFNMSTDKYNQFTNSDGTSNTFIYTLPNITGTLLTDKNYASAEKVGVIALSDNAQIDSSTHKLIEKYSISIDTTTGTMTVKENW